AVGVAEGAATVRGAGGDAPGARVGAAVEGRHCGWSWIARREVGSRAVTAALSDLAAMAAQPIGVLLAIALPNDRQNILADIADGVGEAVDAAHTHILGGNVSSADQLSLTTTVLGAAFSPLRRDGLRPGDRLYVTGRLGGPGAA